MDQRPLPLARRRDFALPDDLRSAIERVLVGIPAGQWVQAARELSERYRAVRQDQGPPPALDRRQALGYLALLLPATYAHLRGAMDATAARVPRWAPLGLVDLGTGPGTALWAAVAQWPSLTSLVALDRQPALLRLGQELARGSAAPAIRGARWGQVNLGRFEPARSDGYDLVVIGHVLNELEPAARAELVERAWAATSGVLLIVEPGTPAGFAVVRAARDQLLAGGARTIAPCVHDQPCPLTGDWCHFPQRLIRPGFQRRARGARSEWEDAKFCYAALARFAPEGERWGRIIREPIANKAYAEVVASTRDGIVRYQAMKRDRAAFRFVRELWWADELTQPPPAPIVGRSTSTSAVGSEPGSGSEESRHCTRPEGTRAEPIARHFNAGLNRRSPSGTEDGEPGNLAPRSYR